MPIFANHAHVFPTDLWPEGDVEHLLALMDACGIERAVAFAPFEGQWKGREGNPTDWIARTVKAHADRLVGYAAINPTRPDAIALLRRAKDLGLRGVKMHPAYEKYSVKSPEAYEFYAAAQDLGLPLDFHVGVHAHRIADFHPLLFDDVARDFPKLRMIFEHVGGWHFFADCLAVISNHAHGEPRLYAGVASVLSRDVQKGWYLGPEGIETMLWQLGDRVIIYGLDFPYNGVDYVRRDLEVIRTMSIPEESKDRLLGGNLRELIGSE
jgi:hypothetical protein